MKRILPLICMLALLTGCSLVPNEYRSVTPHETINATLPDAVEVEDFVSLKNAILRFVKAGSEGGIIRAITYQGNVEEDLVQAAYEVARLDPVGAYAVDYLSHDCVKILNYYEINLAITYRRTGREIAAIQQAYTPEQLQGQVERSLRMFDDRLALQVTEDQKYDIPAIVENYCRADPVGMVEKPEVSVSVFPDSGRERIVEVEFLYEHTPEELTQMREAVEESIDAAAEYIRYRHSDRDKTTLLYTYLTQRFTYAPGTTATPIYSALCEGVADPTGLAYGFSLICKTAGMECYLIDGLLDGEAHIWNIVEDDGDYRHVDLSRCILEYGSLWLQTDWEMNRYYWPATQYPACVAVAPVPEEEPAEEEAV